MQLEIVPLHHICHKAFVPHRFRSRYGKQHITASGRHTLNSVGYCREGRNLGANSHALMIPWGFSLAIRHNSDSTQHAAFPNRRTRWQKTAPVSLNAARVVKDWLCSWPELTSLPFPRVGLRIDDLRLCHSNRSRRLPLSAQTLMLCAFRRHGVLVRVSPPGRGH